MVHIGRERNRYAAKKRGMAAVAAFVVFAAVPVLADTAQEKVIRRLSYETSTGAAGQMSQQKQTIQSRKPASLQMRQEQEQGSYQDRFIRRISGETSSGVGREKSQGKEANRSGMPASPQMSQEVERIDYQEMYVRRLAGGTFPGARGK